ncbi:MAG: tetratricopeptide repeat protein, partial [Myxococcota bacterium]
RLRGMARIRQKLSESALADLEEARRLFQDANTPHLEAQVLDAIGVNLINIGDYRQAEHYLTDALALTERLNLRNLVAGLQLNLAGSLMEQGKFQRAVELQHQARQTAMEIGNTFLVNHSVPNMVVGLIMLNAHEQAIEIGLEALDFARRMNDAQLSFRLLSALSFCAYQLGRFEKALDWAQQAEPFSSDNVLRQIYIHSLFGKIALEQGRIERAAQHLKHTLALASHGGYKQMEADTMTHLARIHRYTGQLDEADVCLKRAQVLNTVSGYMSNELLVECERCFLELARDPRSGPHGPSLDQFAQQVAMSDHRLFRRERERLARAEDSVERGEPLLAGLSPIDFEVIQAGQD